MTADLTAPRLRQLVDENRFPLACFFAAIEQKGDMLALEWVEGIPIVSAREAVDRLRRRMPG